MRQRIHLILLFIALLMTSKSAATTPSGRAGSETGFMFVSFMRENTVLKARAKVRLSEQNTKGKLAFLFIF